MAVSDNLIPEVNKSKKIIIVLLFPFMILLAGLVFMGKLYFDDVSKFYLVMRKLGIQGYVSNEQLQLIDVNLMLDYLPESRNVVVQRKEGFYYISVIGVIAEDLKVPRSENTINNPIKVVFDIPVKMSTGQIANIVFDNYKSRIYFGRDYLDKNEEVFYNDNYRLIQELNNKYYYVDNGYKYILPGDNINIVWKVKDDPNHYITGDGLIKPNLVNAVVNNIFVHSSNKI